MTDPPPPDGSYPRYDGPPSTGRPTPGEPVYPYPTAPYAGSYGTEPTQPYGEQAYGTQPYGGAPYGMQPYGGAPAAPGAWSQYPRPNNRPGTAVAAAVLGFVCGGLLILAGALLFGGASIIEDAQDDFDTQTSYATEFTLMGVLNLVAAGLLIAGGVMLVTRRARGRSLYYLGAALVVVAAIYWIARWSTKAGLEGITVYALLFLALVIVGASLAVTNGVSRWLGGTSPTR